MRKSLWIMLAALLVAIAAPSAQADSFTYSYSDPNDGYSWTTAAIPAVTTLTTVTAADLTSTSTSGGEAGACTISSVTLDTTDRGITGSTLTDFSGCSLSSILIPDGFSQSDYTTAGTYTSGEGDTLVVTDVTTAPEPSSVALMLLGVGILFVTQKRMGRRLPSTV